MRPVSRSHSSHTIVVFSQTTKYNSGQRQHRSHGGYPQWSGWEGDNPTVVTGPRRRIRGGRWHFWGRWRPNSWSGPVLAGQAHNDVIGIQPGRTSFTVLICKNICRLLNEIFGMWECRNNCMSNLKLWKTRWVHLLLDPKKIACLSMHSSIGVKSTDTSRVQ